MLGNYLNTEKCREVFEITEKREFFKVADV